MTGDEGVSVDGRTVVPVEHSTRRGIGWLVLAGLCWGTSGTLGTLLRRESGVGFLSVASLRILVGGLALILVVSALGRLRLPSTAGTWGQIALLGLASGAYQVGFFLGVGTIGVPLATMVAIGSTPVMVAIVDVLTHRVRLRWPLFLSCLLALVGLALLVGAPDSRDTTALTLGVIGSLVAGAGFASISLLGTRLRPDFDAVTGTGVAFLLGGLLVSVVAVFAPGDEPLLPHEWTPAAIVWVVALGVVPTAVAYLSYLRGLRTQTGTVGSLVSLLEPVTAAVVAFFVLGQRLTPVGLVGMVVLLAAVAVGSLVK